MTQYEAIQKRKAYYIPLCCAGKITERKCAEILDMHYVSVHQLKMRYKKLGKSVFVNGHKGLQYQKKKYSDSFRKKIVHIYKTFWPDAPFSTFCENLEKYHHITISYNALRLLLKKEGIKPPRTWSTIEKYQHKTRTERAHAGELVQMDASTHDWFMNNSYISLHGGIDDATHTITGLYFCKNECRLGYNEVLRQTWTQYGVPMAYYIDRHSSFVATQRKKNRTLTELLELNKNESTHFTDLCRELEIEVILALSPQGKGRIERLWQTLQGKLPYIFRYLNIDTIPAANNYIISWVKTFNEKYAIDAREKEVYYRPLPENYNLDYKLSVKFSCRTDSMGYFTFHDCDFRLVAPRRACKHFELCLSEAYGVRAYMEGKWYSVELCDTMLQDVRGDKMPIVEKALIARYLLSDLHSSSYA